MSVFERLYKQSTASSAQKVRTRRSSAKRTPNTSSSSSLDRLSRPTESSLSSRQTETKVSSKKSSEKANKRPQNSPSQSKTPSLAQKISPQTVTEKAYDGPWKLTYTCRYDKASPKGVRGLSPQSLQISSAFHSFEHGTTTEYTLAQEIIEALFDRDHMKGRHWDYDPSWVTPESSDYENVVKFKAEKQATWDWKDIYSVASAKGTICFFKERREIRVEEYSYYAAG